MIYCLDTTAYSELNRGHETIGKLVVEAERLIIPFAVIAELQEGFQLGGKRQANERLLARFLDLAKVEVALPNYATIGHFTEVAVYTRRHGVKLSGHDIWIAALSLQRTATLLTCDKDFHHLAYPQLHYQLFTPINHANKDKGRRP